MKDKEKKKREEFLRRAKEARKFNKAMNDDIIDKYMGKDELSELTKDSINKAFFDVWDAVSELVPTVRKAGVKLELKEVVPLRKALDKLEKKVKKRAEKHEVDIYKAMHY